MLSKIKLVIAKILCNRFTGALIASVCRNKISYFGKIIVNTNNQLVTPYIKSLIFWGLYEKSEAKSVLKYLDKDMDVIELGSSLGVISSLIGKSISNRKLVCVEANPELLPIIDQNLRLNNIENYTILNIGVGNKNDVLWFVPGRHSTHGKMTDIEQYNAIKIPILHLSDLLISEKINNFNLVCDIEGSEIDIILSDPESLQKCNIIIIETHLVQRKSKQYTPEDIKKLIQNLGFECIYSYDVNYIFKNTRTLS